MIGLAEDMGLAQSKLTNHSSRWSSETAKRVRAAGQAENARQFFALACQQIRWELNDLPAA
jgi:hypothetical protein